MERMRWNGKEDGRKEEMELEKGMELKERIELERR
jgi:hypothetical protein